MNQTLSQDAFRLLVHVIFGGQTAVADVSWEAEKLATEIATKNKIFLCFYERSAGLHMKMSRETHLLADQIILRKTAQLVAIKETAALADSLGTEFIVVKTFKPFNYVGDDIDILLHNKRDIEILKKQLQTHGFFVRKQGTPETTLRKFIMNSPVDLDIHDKLAAGQVEYIDSQQLWQNSAKKSIDGVELLIPSPEYEMLITIAHSLIKESRMTLADLYHYVIALQTFGPSVLFELASRNGLTGSLRVFNYVAHTFLDGFAKGQLKHAYGELSSAVRSRILHSNSRMPYAYPPEALIYAHLGNFKHQLGRKGFHAIADYVRLPSSKGIALVFDYLGWVALRKEATPWE